LHGDEHTVAVFVYLAGDLAESQGGSREPVSALDVSNDADSLPDPEDVGRGGNGAYLLVPTGSPSAGEVTAGRRAASTSTVSTTRRPAQMGAMAPFTTARQESGHHQRYASKQSHTAGKTQSPLHASDEL
jgi:hypothetical protein